MLLNDLNYQFHHGLNNFATITSIALRTILPFQLVSPIFDRNLP